MRITRHKGPANVYEKKNRVKIYFARWNSVIKSRRARKSCFPKAARLNFHSFCRILEEFAVH